MHILIFTLGSRGDVQPYVALGKGLKAAGHEVTLCTSARFKSFITEHGLDYGYMNDEMLQLMDSMQGRELMEDATNLWEVIKAMRRLSKQVEPLQQKMLQDCWNVAQTTHPELILFHPKTYGGPHIAEKLGIPVILAMPLPMLVPTAEQSNTGFPSLPFGGLLRGWYNRLTYQITDLVFAFSVGKLIKEWRAEHHLPRQSKFDILHTHTGAQIPVLHCYSRHVAPEPTDWPEKVIASGYWFLDQQTTWEPSAELQAFLQSGDAPVYVGFGSMAGRHPERLTRIVIEALQQAQVRGIIATGWGGLAANDLPETIFKLDQAPHDWLFPQMAAVVHHGGAGTTAAGLRAGCPTVICPFFGDQPFWGQRVHALGVGSKPIPQKKLTVEKLAAAIRKVTTDDSVRQKAQALGERLKQEDGMATAIALIEAVNNR
ncbi:MAG: glycosyltransferase family 1 protein [Leptolyngbya sp. SIO1D8]|nr:glycosyltransferase family 1 protein [Leptolyngbya sp. SIO1D8]